MTLRRRIGNHCLSDVLFSVRTARYTTYRMGGKLAMRPFDLCFYRMTLFESVFTRGGQSEPDDPVNQAVTRRTPWLTYLMSCVTLYRMTCFVYIFHLIWSVTCIAFKFCCILLHAVLTTNKDHTPSQFQSQDRCWSKAVPNHLKSRTGMHILWAF